MKNFRNFQQKYRNKLWYPFKASFSTILQQHTIQTEQIKVAKYKSQGYLSNPMYSKNVAIKQCEYYSADSEKARTIKLRRFSKQFP